MTVASMAQVIRAVISNLFTNSLVPGENYL